MGGLEIVEVLNQELINEVRILADKIWREHYTPIIGNNQVDYMLDKFQSQAAITKQIKDNWLYFLIKEKNSDYIGYIGVIPKKDKMFLSKIYLVSEKRGTGCGKQVVSFIEQLAKKKKCSKIVLTVNKNNCSAIKFYKKCGFINSGSLVQNIGKGFVMDDYKMEKSL